MPVSPMPDADLPDNNGDVQTNITIYDHGTAVIQQRRTISLEAGLNQVEFSAVPAQIDPLSVVLRIPARPGSVTVLEQDFLYDLNSRESMLKRYLGEIVEITLVDNTRVTGQLLSRRVPPPQPPSVRPPFPPADNDNHLTIQQPDCQVMLINMTRIHDIRFAATPSGLATRPTLRWLLESAEAGLHEIEVTYRTTGLSWTAHYNALLTLPTGDQQTPLDLNGWIELTNSSGVTLYNAAFRLASAAPRRQPQEQALPKPGRLPSFATRIGEAQRPLPTLSDRLESSDYRLYSIAHPVTLEREQTRQVQFIDVSDVPATIYFVFNPAGVFSGYAKQPDLERVQEIPESGDVHRLLEFAISTPALNTTLPSGTITVYQKEADGGALMLGEGRIPHMAEGETVRITLGKASGLSGQRIQTDYRQLSRILLEEAYEIHLHNNREDAPVEIRVHEQMFRWRDWEILSASHEFTQIDVGTVEFRVIVQPDEEAIVNYIVRYILPG